MATKTIGDLLSGDPYDGNAFSGGEGLELWDIDKSSPNRSKGITIDQFASAISGRGLVGTGTGSMAVDFPSPSDTDHSLTIGDESSLPASNGGVNVYATYNSNRLIQAKHPSSSGIAVFSMYNNQNVRADWQVRGSGRGTDPNWVKLKADNNGAQDGNLNGMSVGIEDSTSSANLVFRTKATDRMTVKSGGDVVVANNMEASGNFIDQSDRRVKTEIEQISGVLDKIPSGKTYLRTDQKGGRKAGVIAQEIESVLPEAVVNSGNYKKVDQGAVIALLYSAVCELNKKIQ